MDLIECFYPDREPDKKVMIDTPTEVSGFYKTPEGSIINKDIDSLKAYKKKRMKSIELNNMKEDISQLKNDMAEIKELLKGLVK